MLISLVYASDAANGILFSTLEELDENVLFQGISPSHGSILGLIQHMLTVETWFFLSAQGQTSRFHQVDSDSLIELMRQWEDLSRERAAYLSHLTEASLLEGIPLQLGRTQFNLPRYQLFYQSLTHSIHHRGELSILLSNLGHPLPDMDCILYFVEVSGQSWPSD